MSDILLYAVKNDGTNFPALHETYEEAEKFAKSVQRLAPSRNITIERINAEWLRGTEWARTHGYA